MHILGLILSALVIASVWYFRIRQAHRFATDVGDVVGRARAKYRLAKRRKDAAISPVRAIDDPILGAAVLLYSLLDIEGPVSRDQEEIMAQKLNDVTGVEKPESYVSYAKWACDKVPEHTTVIRLLLPLWKASLAPNEASQLYDMAVNLCEEYSAMSSEQEMALSRLHKGLGIPATAKVEQ
jgi:hypothetical protein